MRVTAAGTLSNFRVDMSHAPAAGTWTLTVRKNGIDTVVSCQIANGVTTCSSVATVPFAVNDLLSIEVVPANNPDTPTHVIWRANYN